MVRFRAGICRTSATNLRCHRTAGEFKSKIKAKARYRAKAYKQWEGELAQLGQQLETTWTS